MGRIFEVVCAPGYNFGREREQGFRTRTSMPKNVVTHQRKTQTRAGTVEKAKAVQVRAVEAKAFVKAKAGKAKAERAVAAAKAAEAKAAAKAAKAKAVEAPQSPTYEPSQAHVDLGEGSGCVGGAAPTPSAPEGGRLRDLAGNRDLCG